MENIKSAFSAFAAQEYHAGRIDRRLFLQIVGGTTLSPLLVGVQPAAAAESFAVANYGGTSGEAQLKHWIEPFGKANNLQVSMDTSGPLPGRLREMVKANKVIWDVCDAVSYTSISLGREGLIEPIDYDIVDKKLLRPDSALEFGVTYGWYSTVLAYDKSKFAGGEPKRWADFFNTKDFPGKRALWKYGYAWEAALLAAGVSPEKLYPLDTDKAVEMFQKIKQDCLYFGSPSEGAGLLRDGEVSMAALFSTRAAALEQETDGRITWTWNEGLMGTATWIVPKGHSTARDLIMRFIASTMTPENQIAYINDARFGSANPEVFAKLDQNAQRWDPHNPEWVAMQVLWDDAYYADNEEKLIGLFLEKVASS